jgi:Spy/CpxP family protein refolding chaperone
MKKLKYLIIFISLLMASQVFAQPGPGGGPEMRERMKERIKTIKIWKLTEEVNLTSEQSEKFFPVYNEFQNSMMELEKKRFELLKELDELADLSDVADQKLIEKINNIESINEDDKKLKSKFLNDISSILSVRQQAKLLIFEEHFKRRMQEMIQDVRRGGGRGFKSKDDPGL